MGNSDLFQKLTTQEKKQEKAIDEYYKLIKRLQDNREDRIQKEANEYKKGIREEYLTK